MNLIENENKREREQINQMGKAYRVVCQLLSSSSHFLIYRQKQKKQTKFRKSCKNLHLMIELSFDKLKKYAIL